MQLKDCKFNKENENMNNLNALICVFCEGIVAEKIDYKRTQICVTCNEYKGITTVREFLEVYA
jgi:hypothetical protein